MPDRSQGLYTDFSDEAVHERIAAQTSGLPQHERAGHHSPDPPNGRALSAQAAIDALRHPPDEETGM